MENHKEKVLSVRELCFRYPTSENDVLHNISFDVCEGEFVLICGSSASGKTTLSKCINGIIPHMCDGTVSGSVQVRDKVVEQAEMYELAALVGMVFQNPEDQIFSLRVADEVALGVEFNGYTHDEIVDRTNYALERLRIEPIKQQLIASLSGGQKQKVSIASNLAMRPSILLLDDPTTDLDPVSKQEVMDILGELKKELNMTFIVIEHDLADLIEFTDRVIVMHEGRVLVQGRPDEIFYDSFDTLDKIGVRIPDHIRLAKYLLEKGHLYPGERRPVRLTEVVEWTRKLLVQQQLSFPEIHYSASAAKNKQLALRVEHLGFRYPKKSENTLFDVDFEVPQGEFLAIVGHNGSGKSTLIKNIVGLLNPTEGKIYINGNDAADISIVDRVVDIGYVFQNPDSQLFCNSVEEELAFGLKNRGVEQEIIDRQVERVLKIVGLTEASSLHPFSLSRGERQRLAVATMLVSEPKIVLLDEPTTGQDEHDLAGLLQLMEEFRHQAGHTVIMVTHDMEIVSKYASHVIVFSAGHIVLEDNPVKLFERNNAYLQELKIKPPVISTISTMLKDQGMPYFPNINVFKNQVAERVVTTR